MVTAAPEKTALLSRNTANAIWKFLNIITPEEIRADSVLIRDRTVGIRIIRKESTGMSMFAISAARPPEMQFVRTVRLAVGQTFPTDTMSAKVIVDNNCLKCRCFYEAAAFLPNIISNCILLHRLHILSRSIRPNRG